MKTSPFRLPVALATLLLAAAQPGAADAASSRPVVLVSDLHVGAGRGSDRRWKNIEDFRWQSDFDAFLEHVSRASNGRADLVLLGDVFELWQSPNMECSTDLAKPACRIVDCNEADTELGCAEREAVARLRLVLAQHGDFIASIRAFAAKGQNSVTFVPGNHDAALLFPAVRTVLSEALGSNRITIAGSGHWVSPDGAIYGDHGHQFDELNRFSKWPLPFTPKNGVLYLDKTWGENMVQQFYNQYESVFPIIDNLADEKSGVEYAVKQAGFPNSAAAVRRFFRFFLFQQSLRQAAGSLGTDGQARWDYGAVRALPVGFFMDVFPESNELGASRDALRPTGVDGFDPATLSEPEIDAVCDAKKSIDKAKSCPLDSATLSAVAQNAITKPEERLRTYLRSVLPQAAGAGKRVASAYVYGHTHAGAATRNLALGDLAYGPAEVLVANTGAFQRTATPAQIERILRRPEHRNKRALDLLPEHLPGCYNFVWVAPYAQRDARPELRRWARTPGAPFAASTGSCAGFVE